MASLAPASELVRYLAVFHRAFAAIERYRRDEDWEGAYRSGWLADTLHNAPSVVLNYGADVWYTPERMNEIFEAASIDMTKIGASAHLVRDFYHIFSPQGTAAELGLRDDLSDLSPPPPQKARYYADYLRLEFVAIRHIRSYGEWKPLPWSVAQEKWSEEASKVARLNGHLARAVLPLLVGLVHWETFDEAAFFDRTIALASELSEEDRPQWFQSLEGAKRAALAIPTTLNR